MNSASRRVAFLSHHDDPQSLPALERAAYDWLSDQPEWQVQFVRFTDSNELMRYDAAWWYYAENLDIPQAAMDAVDQVRDYAEHGGKLLLSLLAAKYVEPLGLDRAPDAASCEEESFFYWNGYVALEKHSIFDGLTRSFFVADSGVLRPFASARWLAAPPDNGRVLGIANWGARFVEDERVIVEWDCGQGQVLALGMHNFRFDSDKLSENLLTFTRNILNYMTSSLTVDLSLKTDHPAVPSGTGYLGGHYKNGGVVLEAGKAVSAIVTGKAFRPLDVVILGRTPAGTVDKKISLSPGETFQQELELDVHDIPEGEHIAAIEIMDDNQLLASVDRAFFVVPKAGGQMPLDRHWLWELRSKRMAVEIDKSKGSIWGLYDPSDDRRVQLAANPDNNPGIATPNHRWLGDLELRFRFSGDTSWRSMTTAESSDIRQVVDQEDSIAVIYDPGPPEQIGPTEPGIVQRFSIDQDSLNWRIKIKNRSQSAMILGEVAIPLALNTFFAGEVDLSEIYERKVMLHSFIGGASSWILAAPLGGVPPYLLLWCKEGTKLEAMAHVDDYGPRPEGWEGLVTVFPYSKASRETRGWYEWYNGHSYVCIPADQELILDFGMKFINDYKDIGDTLFEAGKVAVDVTPGMVLPTDMTGHLRVRSKKKVTVQTDIETLIELVRAEETASIYRLRFKKPGLHNITLIDDSGEATNLHFLATAPIEDLARANARHIARDEQYRGPGRRDGMFLMWDAEENQVVTKPRHAYMGGGSDEIGYSEPLILVWKNVVDPVPEEIEVMEYYVERFLYGGVQNKETYAVATGINDDPNEPQDYSRSFNYPHVVSIYFALSKIADYYGLTRFRDSDGYLLMAYRTALAYHTLPMYKNNALACGNFGESLFFDLMDTLRARGFNTEADELDRHIRRKAEHFLAQAHPYLSEYPFDTTGYSDAYYLKKYAGGVYGAAPVVSMLRATRGRQHSWPWYGGDVRWGWGASKYPWMDELCLNYMINQNGRALLDNFHETGHIEDLRLGYGSFLAYWALIEPSGIAHNLYTWEPARMTFDPWTSEMGCGFYFGFLTACSYAVDDPDFGFIGYGCDVEGDPAGHIAVIPRDGVARRIKVCPLGISVESHAAYIDRMDIEYGGHKVNLLLREILGKQAEELIIVKGLPEGDYTLSVNYIEQGTFTAEQCGEGISIQYLRNGSITVQLDRGR